MSENHKEINRAYSKELARKCLECVFDRDKNEGTKGLNSELAEVIFTGLQISESRGRICASLSNTAQAPGAGQEGVRDE